MHIGPPLRVFSCVLAVLIATGASAAPQDQVIVVSGGLYHRFDDAANGYVVGVARSVYATERLQFSVAADFSETRQTVDHAITDESGEVIVVEDRQVRRCVPVLGVVRFALADPKGSRFAPYLFVGGGWIQAWSDHASSVGKATNGFRGPAFAVGTGLRIAERLSIQAELCGGSIGERSAKIGTPPVERFSPTAFVIRLAVPF